jgi:hypothetical protein
VRVSINGAIEYSRLARFILRPFQGINRENIKRQVQILAGQGQNIKAAQDDWVALLANLWIGQRPRNDLRAYPGSIAHHQADLGLDG